MEIAKHICALFLFVLPFMLYSLTVSAYEARTSLRLKQTGTIACGPAQADRQNELPGDTDKAGCYYMGTPIGRLRIMQADKKINQII